MIVLSELIEAIIETFDEGTLMNSLVLRGLFAGLDFDAGGGVFEAEEEVTGMFHVLLHDRSADSVANMPRWLGTPDVLLRSWNAHSWTVGGGGLHWQRGLCAPGGRALGLG